MKITMRAMTFETNSSSTHSCIIIPQRVLDAWEEDKTMLLDFAELLHEARNDPANNAYSTGELVTSVLDLVGSEALDEARAELYRQEEEWVDDEDVPASLKMIPYTMIMDPGSFVGAGEVYSAEIRELHDGIVLDMIYEDWGR